MGSFIIDGGIPLSGTVKISGSKNSALPVLFATILAKGRSRIRNLPRIKDVAVSTAILLELGARLDYDGDDLIVDTQDLTYRQPSDSLVSSLRASTYLIGSMLSRFGRVRLSSFGGCNFSYRPIDFHINAAKAFGAVLCEGGLYAKRLFGTVHRIERESVGATVNSLLLAAAAEGQSVLYGYAREPHVRDLISFLRSMGAQIRESGGALYVSGGQLRGGDVTVRSDMIEAGTYLSAGIATGGKVSVSGADEEELSAFLSPLGDATRVLDKNTVITTGSPPEDFISVTTAPYPGFPTDLQPLLAPVMARACGGSITEQVWQGRFGYLNSLAPFGLRSQVIENTARVFRSDISSADTVATDLRGGAACIVAALMAKGCSRIDSGELIMRGYESPISKFRALGAKIKYV